MALSTVEHSICILTVVREREKDTEREREEERFTFSLVGPGLLDAFAGEKTTRGFLITPLLPKYMSRAFAPF